MFDDAAYTTQDTLRLLYRARDHRGSRGKDPHKDATVHPTGDETPIEPDTSVVKDPGELEAKRAWSKLVFVRDGLFTADEALTYIRYFEEFLDPFTPISCFEFTKPSNHARLISREPVLAITILMISSRFCELPGPGSMSRRFIIHDRIWQFLQNIITRVFWALDEFTASDPVSNLRTIGTCEALLLLCEWHPRALHFPPGRESIRVFVEENLEPRKNEYTSRDTSSWMEWSWRSDRMTWSLLGKALFLATELGVLDDGDHLSLGPRENAAGIWTSAASSKRAYRLQQLLLVFSTQVSGRLGTNMHH